jgi:hypothetical protein
MLENEATVTRAEVVLRSAEADDDVRFHTTRLAIGEVIQVGTRSWRVIAEESPTHIGIQARYICSPA